MNNYSCLDTEAASAHLRALDPTTDVHIWLVTHDTDRERKARTHDGTLNQVRLVLDSAQREGFAVHVAVNAMAARQRLIKAVRLVRAIWIELDGPLTAPLPIPPSLMLRTSPERGHIYWLTDHQDAPTTAEAHAMCRLAAERHGGDLNGCDPARVLRLAGSLHQKSEPHRVAIVGGNGRRYGRANLLRAFPPSPPRPPVPAVEIAHSDRYVAAALRGVVADLGRAAEGSRNATLNRAAFRCGQLGIGPTEAASVLTPTALSLGLTPTEIARTIQSGATAGGQNTREAGHAAR